MRELLFLILLLGSFAGGYWVRELVSRHRRAAAREEYYRKHPKERTD